MILIIFSIGFRFCSNEGPTGFVAPTAHSREVEGLWVQEAHDGDDTCLLAQKPGTLPGEEVAVTNGFAWKKQELFL